MWIALIGMGACLAFMYCYGIFNHDPKNWIMNAASIFGFIFTLIFFFAFVYEPVENMREIYARNQIIINKIDDQKTDTYRVLIITNDAKHQIVREDAKVFKLIEKGIDSIVFSYGVSRIGMKLDNGYLIYFTR